MPLHTDECETASLAQRIRVDLTIFSVSAYLLGLYALLFKGLRLYSHYYPNQAKLRISCTAASPHHIWKDVFWKAVPYVIFVCMFLNSCARTHILNGYFWTVLSHSHNIVNMFRGVVYTPHICVPLENMFCCWGLPTGPQVIKQGEHKYPAMI